MMRARRRSGKRRATPAILSALATLALVWALPPAAAQTGVSVRLDARLGIEGNVRPGRPAPLVVLVESTTLFSGAIEAVVTGPVGRTTVSRPLQVPGGGRATVRLLVPIPDVEEVRAVAGGRVFARVAPGRNLESNDPLVGVVALERPLASSIKLEAIEREVTVVAVAQEILDLGSDALRALTHLVVDADAVARLSPRQRQAMLGFAADGGELVVAAASEAGLSFLPSSWRGTGGGQIRRAAAGSGRVTVVLRPESPARWSEDDPMWRRAVKPIDVARLHRDDLTHGEWFNVLSESGGFRRPAIEWLLMFLIAYVLFAGPLNFFVLARLKRRELAWFTVPALALLFAGGAYVAGRGVRNVPIVQGAGVALVDRSTERDWVALGVLSRSGGLERIRIPGEWLGVPMAQDDGSGRVGPTLRVGRDESVAEFQLPIGAIGTLAAGRVRLSESKSAGTLRFDGSSFTGQVRNPTRFTLESAGVLVGRAFAGIGSLGPGKSTGVTVQNQQPGPEFDPSFIPSPGSFALTQRAAALAGLGESGRAFLFGRVDLREIGLDLGLGRHPGEVLVLAPLDVAVGNGVNVTGSAIRRSIVATDGFQQSGAPFRFVENAREVTVRFELPSGTAPRSLRLRVGGGDGVPFVKVLPVPCPPAPPGGSVDCVSGVIRVPGAPVPVDEARRGSSAALFDFASGRWRDIAVAGDGSFSVAASSRGVRYLSPDGDVFVRVKSEFPTQYALAGFDLTAEA